VIDSLGLPRRPDRAPLLQVICVDRGTVSAEPETWPGLTTEPYLIATAHASVELQVECRERAGSLELSFGYSADLFDHPTILELAERYHRLLVAITQRPEAVLSQIATRGRHVAFVIPGNPLSHVVCWHLVIRAALDMLGTGALEFGLADAPLGGSTALKGNARETWWPARVSWERDGVRFIPLKWQSSGDLTSLTGLDALIRVPAGITALHPGETITARLIRAAGM
ncbi:MAG: hypothetical protein ABI318_12180, partial [Chthoniobacteraceae bacterium]